MSRRNYVLHFHTSTQNIQTVASNVMGLHNHHRSCIRVPHTRWVRRRNKTFGKRLYWYKVMAMENTKQRRLYKLNDLATHMHLKTLKWAERIVRTFDIRIQKRIVEGSCGGRKTAGGPRNGWKDEVSKAVFIFLSTKKKNGSQRKDRSDWRKKNMEAMARKRAKVIGNRRRFTHDTDRKMKIQSHVNTGGHSVFPCSCYALLGHLTRC